MATKRKSTTTKKAAAPEQKPKPKRRKRKKAAKRKRAASSSRSSGTSSGSSKRRTRKPLQLVLRVEDVAINSPALQRLSDAQRVDLAAMDSRKRTFATRPAWAADDAAWRRAVRLVAPHWQRLRNPWPTVAWVYLHSGGAVAEGRRGLAAREDDAPAAARSGRRSARARATTRSTHEDYNEAEEAAPRTQPVRVEQLHVDETGIDQHGQYRGRGLWWRVWNASLDSVVRATSAAAARKLVTGSF
ncbi:MAG TPA: hypothetical protein VFN67_37470 [Polyangiales bacterium]|nr:hypothetical protein [Polyangiales bacterium]